MKWLIDSLLLINNKMCRVHSFESDIIVSKIFHHKVLIFTLIERIKMEKIN